jgi:LysR family cys regulon transcriptional activator
MQIRQLRYLCYIAQHGGSITATARALHTSQPSVSRDLRALELKLGVELFHRIRNRIVGLTDRGHEALRLAQ